MKKLLKKLILVSYFIIQLTILILVFFACTSMIKILPWYKPLTMGAFFVLMYIFPIQVFISIILHFFNREIISKTFNKISNNTTAIIALILLTLVSNIIILAIVCSIIEIILIVKFMIVVIKQFMKIKE